jgi:hypothetical protein
MSNISVEKRKQAGLNVFTGFPSHPRPVPEPAPPPPPAPSPPISDPEHPAPTLTIERAKRGQSRLIFTPRPITYDQMTSHYQSYLSSSAHESRSEIRSKGYLLLMNVLHEIQHPESAKSSSGRHGRGRGKSQRGSSGGHASLVIGNKDRFTPSKLEKTAGLYSEDSDDHFRITITQSLNKLTFETIDLAIGTILPLLDRLEPASPGRATASRRRSRARPRAIRTFRSSAPDRSVDPIGGSSCAACGSTSRRGS